MTEGNEKRFILQNARKCRYWGIRWNSGWGGWVTGWKSVSRTFSCPHLPNYYTRLSDSSSLKHIQKWRFILRENWRRETLGTGTIGIMEGVREHCTKAPPLPSSIQAYIFLFFPNQTCPSLLPLHSWKFPQAEDWMISPGETTSREKISTDSDI